MTGGSPVRKIVDLSIIIATWNNSRRLALTLEAFRRCRVPQGVEWQIVLVNNNSEYETGTIAKSYADKLPLVYVQEPRRGVSRARNKGLETASGKLILFTDDDVKPCAGWIEAYWHASRSKPDGFFFGGPVQSEFASLKPDPELLCLAPPSVKGLTFGPTARELAAHERFVGANWACAAEPLKDAGGFDVSRGAGVPRRCLQSGEETLLMHRLRATGMRAWYLPEAGLAHFVPAEKCTLKHIGHRLEMYGYFTAWERCSAADYKETPMLFGVPAWMYRKAMPLLLAWGWARMKRQKGYREWLEWRRFVGTMLGVRDVIVRNRLGSGACQGRDPTGVASA